MAFSPFKYYKEVGQSRLKLREYIAT